MKCSKCGHENKPGSEFCSRCGAKLKLERPKKTGASKGNKIIIFLIVIIVILVIAIGLVLGMKSSKSGSNKTVVKTTAVSKKKKGQSSKGSQQSAASSAQQDTSANLKVSDLNTPELMSAAVALYGGKNINGLWSTFKDPSFVGSEISITTAQEQNVSEEGNGNFYNFSIDSHDTGMGYGGGIGYVLSNDGKMVYFYQIGVSPDSKIPPKLEVPVNDIVNWVNQNHMADTVRSLANRLYVK